MKQYTDREMSIAKLALRYYNLQAGMAYRMGGLENPDSNGNVILRRLEAVNFDMGVAREHIKNYVREEKENNPKCNPSIRACFMALRKKEAEAEIVEQPVPAPAPAPVQQASAPSSAAPQQPSVNIQIGSLAETMIVREEADIDRIARKLYFMLKSTAINRM